MDSSQVVIIILLVLTVALIIYVLVIRGQATRTIATETKKIHDESHKLIKARTEALLRLAGIPFLWAVRSELLKENYHQIEEYLNQFVKEDGVRAVVVVDMAGNIKIATDKKWEGKPYSEIFKQDIGSLNDIVLHDLENDEKLMLAPITGINEKLGTVAILYHPKEVSF
jgi:sensor histidine kinase regulating citrate/malate metabolism